MSIITKVLGGLAGPVVDYFKQRAEIKSKERLRKMELDDALQARKLELISQGLTADMNWEMEFARQAEHSWKDEYTLIVISIPAVLCFIKNQYVDGPAIVAAGFGALAQTPLWYQAIFGIMFCATVGVRWWRRTQSDT